MKRILIISLIIFVFFIIEFILFNIFGWWFRPNLILLFLIFLNLYFGLRYSLFAAVFAGIIKDSFSTGALGFNTFSFILCVYVTALIKRYLYEKGSYASRMFLAFLISIVNVVIHYLLNVIVRDIYFSQAFVFVMLPEVLMTTIVATFTFKRLKRFVLRLWGAYAAY